ncbi:hypothetical protein VTH06DRAFT_4140 [Thermothelomyces fergusii]
MLERLWRPTARRQKEEIASRN